VANSKESSRRSAFEPSANTPREQPKFEDELSDLEAIVTRIDSGELSLEDSIGAFERGVGLVRSLNQRLDEAERRVELLMRGAGGSLKSTPLQTGDGEEEAPSIRAAPPRPTSKDDEDIPF